MARDREIELLFHRLWTKAVGTEGYDKSEWKVLQLSVVEGLAPDVPAVTREPTSPGWWARKRTDSVEWFEVCQVEKEGKPGQGYHLVCWNQDTRSFYPIRDYCGPGTKWYGPVITPFGT